MKKYQTTFWAITRLGFLNIQHNGITKKKCIEHFLCIKFMTMEQFKRDGYGCVKVSAFWGVK